MSRATYLTHISKECVEGGHVTGQVPYAHLQRICRIPTSYSPDHQCDFVSMQSWNAVDSSGAHDTPERLSLACPRDADGDRHDSDGTRHACLGAMPTRARQAQAGPGDGTHTATHPPRTNPEHEPGNARSPRPRQGGAPSNRLPAETAPGAWPMTRARATGTTDHTVDAEAPPARPSRARAARRGPRPTHAGVAHATCNLL